VRDAQGANTNVYGEATKEIITNYHPMCDKTKTSPACIAISPTTGESLVTAFTFTAGHHDAGTKSGWIDTDGPDTSLQYRFGYLLNDESIPTMLSSDYGAQGANTYTFNRLPVGQIRPVVYVKDSINGETEMYTGANITVCATANCATLADTAAIGNANSKLSGQISAYGSSGAQKNTLAASFDVLATTINGKTTDAASLTQSVNMRTTMVNYLEMAIANTEGPAPDVAVTGSALRAITGAPVQLTSSVQSKVVGMIDSLLGLKDTRTNGIAANIAGDLIAVVGNVAAARELTTGGGGRRSAEGNKMMQQMSNISLTAALKMVIGQSALQFQADSIRASIRKENAGKLNSQSFGWAEDLYSAVSFVTPSTFDPWPTVPRGVSDYVVIETTSSPYAHGAMASDMVTLSISLPDHTILSGGTWGTNKMQVKFNLNNDTNSPECVSWNENTNTWSPIPNSLLSANTAKGSSVTCAVSSVGSFAVRESCTAATTCSGRGTCLIDGKCKCELGYTGVDCSTSYCDDVLFPCMGGLTCACQAPPFDCVADCKALGTYTDAQCTSKCGKNKAYTTSTCPTVTNATVGLNYRQTRCVSSTI
jgi:hypothetical protein